VRDGKRDREKEKIHSHRAENAGVRGAEDDGRKGVGRWGWGGGGGIIAR